MPSPSPVFSIFFLLASLSLSPPPSPSPSPLPGIGQGRVTDNLAQDIDLLDGAVHIPDADSIEMIYSLLDTEGIYIGASSALNVVSAVRVAEKLGKGKTVVTILCDGAYRFVLTPSFFCLLMLCLDL
jgi:cysteine synthase